MSDPFLLALSPQVRRAVALILNAIELNPVILCQAHCVKRTHTMKPISVSHYPMCAVIVKRTFQLATFLGRHAGAEEEEERRKSP